MERKLTGNPGQSAISEDCRVSRILVFVVASSLAEILVPFYEKVHSDPAFRVIASCVVSILIGSINHLCRHWAVLPI
jgi:hypothetical protein